MGLPVSAPTASKPHRSTGSLTSAPPEYACVPYACCNTRSLQQGALLCILYGKTHNACIWDESRIKWNQQIKGSWLPFLAIKRQKPVANVFNGMLGRQFGCSEMDEACPKSENDVRLLSKLIHLNPICLHVGVVSCGNFISRLPCHFRLGSPIQSFGKCIQKSALGYQLSYRGRPLPLASVPCKVQLSCWCWKRPIFLRHTHYRSGCGRTPLTYSHD